MIYATNWQGLDDLVEKGGPTTPDTRRGSPISIPKRRLAALHVPPRRRDRRVHHWLHFPRAVHPAKTSRAESDGKGQQKK